MSLLSPPPHEIVRVAQTRLENRQFKGILCDYRAGVLHLRGRARSFYRKQLAQEVVRPVDGVAQVMNEIEVEYGPQ
jgi:hypothetical protein